jgi:hypothetical protein
VTENADLTQFGDDDGTAQGTGADGAASTDEEAPDDAGTVGDDPAEGNATDPAEVDPATTTSAWGADGACEACGVAARRRWRDGEQLVCADCKSW